MPESKPGTVYNIISKQSPCNTVYKSDRCIIDLMNCMVCEGVNLHEQSARYLNVMHSHSVYEFHFMLNGETEIELEGKENFTLGKNHFIIIPPSLKHAIKSESKDFKKILISFDLDITENGDEFYSLVIKLMRTPTPYKCSVHMTKLFSIISDIINSDIHDKYNMVFCLLISYIIEFCNVIAEKQDIKNNKIGMDNRVDAAIQFIKNNLSLSITTADVAKSVYVSPKHLSRIFKEELGQSPAEYIRMAKNEYICKLLAETNLTLSDIAELVGVPDSAALIKRFKRVEGKTPIKYKQSISEVKSNK